MQSPQSPADRPEGSEPREPLPAGPGPLRLLSARGCPAPRTHRAELTPRTLPGYPASESPPAEERAPTPRPRELPRGAGQSGGAARARGRGGKGHPSPRPSRHRARRALTTARSGTAKSPRPGPGSPTPRQRTLERRCSADTGGRRGDSGGQRSHRVTPAQLCTRFPGASPAPAQPAPSSPASSGVGGAILGRSAERRFRFRFRVGGGAAAAARATLTGGAGPGRVRGLVRAGPAPGALPACGARGADAAAAAGPDRAERGHGGQAAHPHGQREAQQEHHPARQRRQDLENGPGGEGVGRALAAGAVHLRGLRISHLPDYPEHPDGHVRGRAGPWPPGPGRRRSCRGAARGTGRVAFQVPSRVIPSFLARATVP